jgi:RNA-directed DNA polymerase
MQALPRSLQNSGTLVLSTDERVHILQRKLYLKAKQDEAFKFYVLYDKIRLEYFPWKAYCGVKANGGASGWTGLTLIRLRKQGCLSLSTRLR